MLPSETIIGAVSDAIGRRILVTLALSIIGISMVIMTFFSQLWVLTILFVIFCVCGTPTYTAPLVNDYVHPDSYGVFSAY